MSFKYHPPFRLSLLGFALLASATSLGVGEEPGPSPLFTPFVQALTHSGNVEDHVESAYDEIDEMLGGTSGSTTIAGASLSGPFFNRLTIHSRFRLSSLELMKQHVWFAEDFENTSATGWRVGLYHNDLTLAFGDEVRGGWFADQHLVESVRPRLLRDLLEQTRLSAYTIGGVRGMVIEDDFAFSGHGSLFGGVGVNTRVDHNILGPQLGIGFVAEASIFRLEAVALGLVGYSHVDIDQSGGFGVDEVIPGALNRSVFSSPIRSSHHDTESVYSLHGELRVTASCQLTQRWRFDALWRYITTGPVVRAYDSTRFSAPSFGIYTHHGEPVSTHDLFLGLTYTH